MRTSSKYVVSCAIASAFLVSFSLTAIAGGEGSGGGNGIVFPSCRVRFLDFISEDELRLQKATTKQIDKCFYMKRRHVSRLGSEFPDGADGFWLSAVKALTRQSTEFPIFRELIPVIKSIRPLLLESRIHYNQENQKQFLSSSLPLESQEPIAYYSNNWLVLSRRIIEQLSKEDLTGLAIHESLRHLNYHGFLETPLTTQEIEVLTRALAGRTRVGDVLLPVYAKLKEAAKRPELGVKMDAVRAEKDRIRTALQDSSLTSEQVARLQKMDNNCERKEGQLIAERLDRAIWGLSKQSRQLDAAMTNIFLEHLLTESGNQFDLQKINSLDIEKFLELTKESLRQLK